MSGGEKTIATLVGKLRFDVDTSGLVRFEKLLDGISRKMQAMQRQANTLQRKLGISPKGTANIQKQLAAQQKLSKQQFADNLKLSKLTPVKGATPLSPAPARRPASTAPTDIKHAKQLAALQAQQAKLSKQAFASQQKLSKAQFAEQLKLSKLAPVAPAKPFTSPPRAAVQTEQQALKLATLRQRLEAAQAKTAQQQAKATALANKAALDSAKLQNAQKTFGLRQEQQALRLQQERIRLASTNSRLEATRARTQAASDRARLTALRLEEKLSKALPRGVQPASKGGAPARSTPFRSGGSGRGFGASMSHVLAGGAGVGVGASIPGLGMFSAGLHPAAIAIGAVATAAALAASKLNQLAHIDVKLTDERRVESANLGVATGSPEAAAAATERLTTLANDLGVVRADIEKPYVQAMVNFTKAGVSSDDSADMLQGLISFGRGAGVSSDDQAGALRAITQSLSKGQLMAEEMRSQLGDRMPGSIQIAAEAWAKLTKSGLTGEKANAAFNEAMEERQIKGDKLLEFWKNFGEALQRDANAGGRLDVIRQSAESSEARIANLKQERNIKTAEFDDGRLKKASIELFQSKEALEESLNKLVPGFSSLESASLKLEARFYDMSAQFIEWLSTIQDKLDTFEPSPDLLRFIESLSNVLEALAGQFEPVLTLLEDVVTFMADVAIDSATESWKEFFSTFSDGLDGLEGILESFPNAIQIIVDKLRNMIGGLLDKLGLGDKWKAHVADKEQDRNAAADVEKHSNMRFMSGDITPEVKAGMAQLTAPSPMLQNAISNHTANTSNVMQFSPVITVHAGDADAKEVVQQLENKLQDMAQNAFRSGFQGSLETAKTNLVQTKK